MSPPVAVAAPLPSKDDGVERVPRRCFIGGGEAQAEDVGRHGGDGRGLRNFASLYGGVGGAWRPSPQAVAAIYA
jgi:hypothetical protein